MKNKSYFILGSCVSRDCFPGSLADRVAGYVARSPLGSAFAPKPNVPEPEYSRIESRFQRRCLHGDWNKTLIELLGATTYDYLLVDLIDERFDLGEIGGSLVTISNELRQVGYPLEDIVRHRFGSDKHAQEFQQGWMKLVQAIGPEKIVLSRAYWADKLDTGDPTGDKWYIDQANQNLDHLYENCIQSGVKVINYDKNLIVGDSGHKWGASPFHYIAPFYERTRQFLDELP